MMEKEKMHTSTMNKIPIPFWEYTRWIEWLSHEEPERVGDFAKSFSENQVYAKTWLIERMFMTGNYENKNVCILGGWYGTVLVPLLTNKIKTRNIRLIDLDKRTCEIAKHIFPHIKVECLDINFDLEKLSSDVIINTSCEHMLPMNEFDLNGLCVFQSNNFREEMAHINCVDSLEEFIEQTGIQDIHYSGKIPFHKYDDHHERYMVIGKR